VEAALRGRCNLEREADFQIGDRLLHCRQRVFLLEDAGRGGPEVLDVIEDITEQRRRREEHLQAERLGAVVRLAGGLAHEISQPLAAVSGRAELLQMALEDRSKPADPADLARHVESLRENCRRMGEIVHRLQNIDEYVTRPYYGTTEILDLGRSSSPPPEDGKEPAGK
jgi:signal transduction histidine kinase